MEENLIQWPKAKWWTKSWSPVIGCNKISPACENCWAKAWADRFGQSFDPHVSSKQRPPKSGVIFVGGLTDMFGNWCDRLAPPEAYIRDAIKAGGSEATYIWLTKRPERMAQALNGTVDVGIMRVPIKDFSSIQEHHYFGFTAENQEWFDKRSEALEKTLCASTKNKCNIWISAEPLLGPIELQGEICRHLSWLVVGSESGPRRRPCKIEWVEGIVDQCKKYHIPVFVKQLCLPNGKFTNKIGEFPQHLRVRQVPWVEEARTK